MSEANSIPSVTEKEKQPEAVPVPVLDWGIGTLLNAQAEILAGAEATMSDWLRRRHEAVVDTKQLVASMHIGADPADAFKAQREYLSRSFQRLAAEADACQTATRRLMERTPAWFPRGGWSWLPRSDANTETASSQAAAATRAAGKPLRMANKPD